MLDQFPGVSYLHKYEGTRHLLKVLYFRSSYNRKRQGSSYDRKRRSTQIRT